MYADALNILKSWSISRSL